MVKRKSDDVVVDEVKPVKETEVAAAAAVAAPEVVEEVVAKKIKTSTKKSVDKEFYEKCKKLIDVFDIYFYMIKKSKQALVNDDIMKLYNPINATGELIVCNDLIKENGLGICVSKEEYVKNRETSSIGYDNDIIEFNILPKLKSLISNLISSSDSIVLNASFVFIVENHMEIISDNYRGEPKNMNECTIKFLETLVKIYEHAWSKTYVSQSNYVSTKDYIVAVSNRIHALYWHIKQNTPKDQLYSS